MRNIYIPFAVIFSIIAIFVGSMLAMGLTQNHESVAVHSDVGIHPKFHVSVKE